MTATKKAKKRENLFAKHLKSNWKFFDQYVVKLRLRDIVGGIPQNPELIEAWLSAGNKIKSKEERDKIRDAHLDMLGAATDEKREGKGIGFHRTIDGTLCIEGRQLKSMLKEAANIIKDKVPTGKTEKGKPVFGILNLKSKVADQVFVVEEFIPIGRTKPDETREKPIHVQTPQGLRDSIKVYEICHDVEIEFTVNRFMGTGKMAVPEATLMGILDYAQYTGLGADRSQGRGVFEVISTEKV